MRPLTDAQRTFLVERVARSLAWYATVSVYRDTYRFQAKAIVRDLEEIGVTGATMKRAVERLFVAEPEPTEVAS